MIASASRPLLELERDLLASHGLDARDIAALMRHRRSEWCVIFLQWLDEPTTELATRSCLARVLAQCCRCGWPRRAARLALAVGVEP